MFQLVRSRQFDRRLRRFERAHPDLRNRIAAVLRDLEVDPFQPHLHLHALTGRLQGRHAVSVTFAYRVVLILDLTESEIVLIDIGSHDEVYG